MRKNLVFLFLLLSIYSSAQDFDLEVGPMFGHYTDSTRNFWILVKPPRQVNPYAEWVSQFNVALYEYFEKEWDAEVKQINKSLIVKKNYLLVNGVLRLKKTKKQKRDISFLVGSCAFPYPFLVWSGKKKEVIFNTMTKHDKDFMIWMGDNVYYLGGDWNSNKKMHNKNLKMRFKPQLKNFLESCPQYATWDDHDYGKNNDGSNNKVKYNTLEMFKTYWANPSYGTDSVDGVFCKFRQSDAEFFMLDSRFHANDTTMLGKGQTEWLKESLKSSTANFKFIISGTQILVNNPMGEDLGDFGSAKKELLDFLKKEKITGVIFLSGDRHYGELMKMEREDAYPLYEMTTSPLTSIINPAYTKENPYRISETLVLDLNFGKIHLFGNPENRHCRLELFDRNGKRYWQQDIFLSELQ